MTRTEWLSVEALADRLDVKVGHLRALVARNEVPYARVGRLIRFHWPTVETWLLSGGEARATAPTSKTPQSEHVECSETMPKQQLS